MSAKPFTYLLSALLLTGACAKPCSVVWTEGATDPESRTTVHELTILNPPAGTDWTLWFCQFRTPVKMEEGAPGSIDHIAGTLYRVVPTADTKGKTMTLRYEARALVNRGRAPEAFYLQKKGKKPVPVDLEYVFQPAEPVQSFTYNHVETTAYDMIPRLKSVTPGDGTVNLDKVDVPEATVVPGQKPGWYRITVDNPMKVEAADGDGAFWAAVTVENLRRNAAGKEIPAAVIEDCPDLPYRGIMLDVSRNFTRKEDVKRLLDIMAHYKLNYLHFHLGDDEGWRVEIDGLPELTSYGAFRGIPELKEDGTVEEKDAMMSGFCGSLDRNDTNSPANGYYSKADYIDILRYAWERRIRVIPEFDTPGHSRAAIKSMDYRTRTTGDRTYLLSEPEDTSKYVSAQDFTDNALNVAFPSTYIFLDKVFDGIIALHKEAGVPLEAVHVGGDEVPEGAWEGSPACQALMKEKGMKDINELKDYFISRVLDIAEAKGVKIAGWQEVAQHLSPATFDRLRKNLFFANLWTVSHGREVLAYEFANQGVPVVLSNAPNYYFDFAYNDSKLERGHNWGGLVDERRCFSFLPYDHYKSVRWDDHRKIVDIAHASDGKPALTPAGKPFIVGVSGQLWGETIRNFDHVTYYLFPKAVGLVERGWNADPVWSGTTVSDDPAFMDDFDKFFSIVVDHEYPYYEGLGISWHRN